MSVTHQSRAAFWRTNRIGRTARRGPVGAPLDASFQKGRVQALMRHIAGTFAGILFPMFALAFSANAGIELISNGGFESNGGFGTSVLTGWTVASSPGSGGSWFADNTNVTPLTGNPTVGPASGSWYAVTDQFGPGVNALSQDYTVPVGTTSLTLTFDMFINDWAPSTGTASSNVLILGAGGDPVTGAGTLQTLLMGDTLVSGGQPNPYIAYNYGITGYIPGDTYILGFQESDTMFNMNVGLDNISLNAVVPEPGSLALLLGALAAMAVFGRRRFGAIWRQTTLLFVLAAIGLSSHPVRAQSQNTAHAVVPRATLQPGQVRPYAWKVSILNPLAVVHGPGDTNCGGGVGQDTCYYFPSDINTAYTTGFISNGNGGAGMTVAVVDAYFNSQTESDLLAFTTDFGLPACTIGSGCLTIVGQTCGAPPPQPPITSVIAGWFQETDLDLQWVHAIAPKAKILLVAADSSSGSDLYTAVQCAKVNADVVTDSWGGGEFAGEATFDPLFSSAVPILFSAGDAFAATQYPCMSPNVTCVGGTHLLETFTSHRVTPYGETVWDESAFGGGGTGGGCSSYETEPPFQSGFSTCGTQRGAPDVAGIADEFTGVLVYLGGNASGGSPGLYVFGGTSLASPVMAGMVANIDASRVAAGKGKLGGSATSFNLTALLYQAAVSPYYHYRLYDVTSGTNATGGWDTATGLGVTLNPALTFYLNSLP